jgi:hypothetical protein
MTETISTVNIAGAALITQISLLTIMASGAIIFHFVEITSNFNPRYYVLGFILLIFSLASTFCLVYSDEFATLWKPVFRSTEPTLLSWKTSITIMFHMDIILVTILVAMTGGSANSPFTPVYFILPALSIFLSESLARIVLYLVFVCIVFTINLFVFNYNDDKRGGRFALWFVSVACFILATYIGYITRP